jgi:predicted metalloprotease with PDZ domain
LERLRRDGCARLALGIALEDGGLRLYDVQVGGPAYAAGLREGDELQSIGGEAVTAATLVTALKKLANGRAVLVGYGRGTERLTTAVTPDGTIAMVEAFEEFCAGFAR